MHSAIETGLQCANTASPNTVQFSTSNHDQDTIPACMTCGTTEIAEIGYSREDGLAVWECANGHRSQEVDEEPVMPAYVEAALAEIAAHCYGEYDWAGDTLRDEGRAA